MTLTHLHAFAGPICKPSVPPGAHAAAWLRAAAAHRERSRSEQGVTLFLFLRLCVIFTLCGVGSGTRGFTHSRQATHQPRHEPRESHMLGKCANTKSIPCLSLSKTGFSPRLSCLPSNWSYTAAPPGPESGKAFKRRLLPALGSQKSQAPPRSHLSLTIKAATTKCEFEL